LKLELRSLREDKIISNFLTILTILHVYFRFALTMAGRKSRNN
jgi:hypothetical protein